MEVALAVLAADTLWEFLIQIGNVCFRWCAVNFFAEKQFNRLRPKVTLIISVGPTHFYINHNYNHLEPVTKAQFVNNMYMSHMFHDQATKLKLY